MIDIILRLRIRQRITLIPGNTFILVSYKWSVEASYFLEAYVEFIPPLPLLLSYMCIVAGHDPNLKINFYGDSCCGPPIKLHLKGSWPKKLWSAHKIASERIVAQEGGWIGTFLKSIESLILK